MCFFFHLVLVTHDAMWNLFVSATQALTLRGLLLLREMASQIYATSVDYEVKYPHQSTDTVSATRQQLFHRHGQRAFQAVVKPLVTHFELDSVRNTVGFHMPYT